MEKLIKTIEQLAPFLAGYPTWAKFLLSAWVLLTAVSLLTLVFARPTAAEKGQSAGSASYWLSIDGVETYGPWQTGQARVTAIVNGLEYTYPSLERIEWAEIGPDMSSQQFRLPPPKNEYELRFRLQLRQGSRTDISMVSQKTVLVNPKTEVPYRGKFEVYGRDGRMRSGRIGAVVKFSLSSRPD